MCTVYGVGICGMLGFGGRAVVVEPSSAVGTWVFYFWWMRSGGQLMMFGRCEMLRVL